MESNGKSNNMVIMKQSKKISELQNKVNELENIIYTLTNSSHKPQSQEYIRIVERNGNSPSIPSKIPYMLSPLNDVHIDNSHIENFNELDLLDQTNSDISGATEKFSFNEQNSIGIVNVNLTRAIMDDASEFSKHLEEIISNNPNIVVDLRKCSFFDSSFLGALIKSLKLSLRKNGEIKLVMKKESKSILFHLSTADKIFTIFDNIEEALQSFLD